MEFINSSFNDQDVIKYDNRVYTLEMLNQAIERGLTQNTQIQQNNVNISISVANEFSTLLRQENILNRQRNQPVFNQSLDCEVLRTEGGGWKKGKIRFRYVAEIVLDEEEVISCESESPLDDIRQSIQEQTKS